MLLAAVKSYHELLQDIRQVVFDPLEDHALATLLVGDAHSLLEKRLVFPPGVGWMWLPIALLDPPQIRLEAAADQ